MFTAPNAVKIRMCHLTVSLFTECFDHEGTEYILGFSSGSQGTSTNVASDIWLMKPDVWLAHRLVIYI